MDLRLRDGRRRQVDHGRKVMPMLHGERGSAVSGRASPSGASEPGMDPSENEDVRDDAVATKAGSRALRAFVLEIGRTLSLAGTTASPDPVMPRIWSVMSSSSAKIYRPSGWGSPFTHLMMLTGSDDGPSRPPSGSRRSVNPCVRVATL